MLLKERGKNKSFPSVHMFVLHLVLDPLMMLCTYYRSGVVAAKKSSCHKHCAWRGNDALPGNDARAGLGCFAK